MEIGLLDYLVLRTSPTFVSSLRVAPGLCASAIRRIDDAEAFGIDEWNEAGAYLCPGYVARGDCESARRALAEALDRNRIESADGRRGKDER